jgi:hypothetical protein
MLLSSLSRCLLFFGGRLEEAFGRGRFTMFVRLLTIWWEGFCNRREDSSSRSLLRNSNRAITELAFIGSGKGTSSAMLLLLVLLFLATPRCRRFIVVFLLVVVVAVVVQHRRPVVKDDRDLFSFLFDDDDDKGDMIMYYRLPFIPSFVR